MPLVECFLGEGLSGECVRDCYAAMLGFVVEERGEERKCANNKSINFVCGVL